MERYLAKSIHMSESGSYSTVGLYDCGEEALDQDTDSRQFQLLVLLLFTNILTAHLIPCNHLCSLVYSDSCIIRFLITLVGMSV